MSRTFENIWKLFRCDLHSARSNTITLIIVIGLVAIPSIFSWYNMLACWGVFENTDKLDVAVANADEGYQSDLVPLPINMGDQVLSALRANDELHWVFTDEEEAIDGTKGGRYYAAVVIPKDFSQDMMSFYAPDAQPAELMYYSNEKINAIAPKLLNVGADKVSSQVNSTFDRALSEIALGTTAALYDYLQRSGAGDRIDALAGHMGELGSQICDSADALRAYNAVFASTRTLLDQSQELITNVSSSADQAGSSIDEALGASQDALTALGSASDSLATLIGELSQESDTAKNAIDGAFDDSEAAATQAEQSLRRLAQIAEAAGNTQQSQQLTQAADAIAAANASTQEARAQALQRAENAYGQLQEVQRSYEEELKPQLETLASTLEQGKGTLADVAAALGVLGSDMGGATHSLSSHLGSAQGAMDRTADALSSAGEKLNARGEELASALASGDLEAIRDVIGSDPMGYATDLANMVEVKRTAIYPVDNFGSAMGPLYTILALWVGALLILVALKVRPSEETLRKLDDPTPRQVYFGHFGIIALIGLMQSTCVGLGNLFFIGVQVEHPFLYMLCMWVSSLVFCFIIYTLIALFANLGKAISVIVLVLQISGGGGSYPLALLPTFFQKVSPFLPITHSINAMRDAMFGIYHADFWLSLGCLLLFTVPLLIMVILFIKPLNKLVPHFLERIQASKLM